MAAVRIVTADLRAGDVVAVTRAASVQFLRRPFVARVIRVRTELLTYHGWCWLDVYQLDERGDAVARRTIFVQPAGLRVVDTSAERVTSRVPAARRASTAPSARRMGK
ncbi:hypothetical protein [Micromonospora sp. SH-82]|uniref:hypothetical protein n=1 Tax=Micromonospora sp. SH-82 TaxID=3132938 RepID=UPI003EB69DB1